MAILVWRGFHVGQPRVDRVVRRGVAGLWSAPGHCQPVGQSVSTWVVPRNLYRLTSVASAPRCRYRVSSVP